MIFSVIILFAMVIIYNKSQIKDDVKPRGCLAFLLTRIHQFFSNVLIRIRQRYPGMYKIKIFYNYFYR